MCFWVKTFVADGWLYSLLIASAKLMDTCLIKGKPKAQLMLKKHYYG